MNNNLKFFLKLNIFNDKKKRMMLLLVFICQVLFIFIGFFSYSSIRSTLNGAGEQGKFTVKFETNYTMFSFPLGELRSQSENMYIYVDETLVARNKSIIVINRGRDIEKSGEIIACRDLELEIGDEYEMFDRKFLVVGISGMHSEIFIDDLPSDYAIESLTVINRKMYSSKDKEKYASTLRGMFPSGIVTEPKAVKFDELYNINDYFKIVIGILVLSFATIAMTIYYTISIRKSNYTVFKLVGMSGKSLYGYTIIESTGMILAQSIIASLLYLTFDLTVNSFIQMNAYGSYYRINFWEYLVFIVGMWAVYVLINVLSITRLKLKRLKEYL